MPPADAVVVHHPGDTPRALALLLSGGAEAVHGAVLDPHGPYANKYRAARWELLADDQPYAVRVSRRGRFHTLAFDFDAKPGLQPAEDAAAVKLVLAEAGVHYVEAVSGPAGGRHLLATFPEDSVVSGELAAAIASAVQVIAPSLDKGPLTNARAGLIRPPLSPHRAGGRSRLITPLATAVEILRAGNDIAAAHRLLAALGVPEPAPARGPELVAVSSRPRRPLSPATAELRRIGDTTGRFDSRSAVAASVALGYVNAGWSYADFLRDSRDPGNEGLAHVRTELRSGLPPRVRPRSEADGYAQRLWTGAVRYSIEHPALTPEMAVHSDTAELCGAVLKAVEASAWGGQPGAANLAVLLALTWLVARCGRDVVTASVRQLAEDSGVSKSTAAAAVRRLVALGWVVDEAAAEGPNATGYRVQVPPDLCLVKDVGRTLDLAPQGAGPATAAVTRLGLIVRTQQHDALTFAGLRRHASRILAALLGEASSAQALADRTGYRVRTVRGHLRRLADAGLARLGADGLWSGSCDQGALDLAARLLGARGYVAGRREEHQVQRLLFRWYLADFAARRGWSVERGLWVRGHGRLLGADPREVPLDYYPRAAARASWVLADYAVRAGRVPALPHDRIA